ncbi:uncharacterized protein LOC135845895 [Planococcus citri]|uniref:uncharacterized protein LOC135845895 n=1 Tax=Planococcus citri TaxID=170843 RepID=UPI0031F83284
MSSLEPLCNFRRNPCSLELTASVVSAAVLCRRAAFMNPTNPPEKVQEIIALPPAIEQKIKRFMPTVKEQIESWSDFYDREIFFDTPGSSRAEEYFHVLVWSADGTINEEETAREMLKQDSLSTAKKYRIACNHCLKNEIRTLWSNLKTKVNLGKAERRYPLVYYWESFCRKGKTTGMIKYIIDEVFNGESMYPVCAVNYFLNRLNLEKRINFLRARHLQKMSFRSWENFLIKLTNEQLAWLFNDSETWKFVDHEQNLFYYLMRFWMHADFVMQIWMRIRDEFPDCDFSLLIKEFLDCENPPFLSTDHISLAVDIFNLAPYETQTTVFDDYIQEEWWNRDSNLTDVRLDVVILSTIYPDYRRYKFWYRKWIDLFKKYPADCFVQFMNVCCKETTGGSEEFKMEVLEMDDEFASEHCYVLLSGMRFSEIGRFLCMFSSDPSRILKTKQPILRDDFLKYINWFETDKFIFPPSNQLVNFIEESFESIRSANEFKIEVLSSVKCLKACYKAAGNDMFDWLKDAVWMCSCNDDDFKRYKNKFLQLCVELAKLSESPVVFKDPGWILLLEWCSN